MTFSTNFLAKFNSCTLLQNFCQGFTSAMWLNMSMNCFSPTFMNPTSLFSYGCMNYFQPPDMNAFPTLFSNPTWNCYSQNNNSYSGNSLFANNTYVNNAWSIMPQYSWNTMPITTIGSGTRSAENVEYNCCKNPPPGIVVKTFPNGQRALATPNCRLEHCHKDWANMQKYLMQAADEMGLTLVYSCVERTVAESDALRAQAADKRTVAPGGTSTHNFGIAADIRLYNKKGERIPIESSLYTEFANKVKRLSNNAIEWGGDWPDIGNDERWHFNIRNRNKYRNCRVPINN